MNAEKTAIARKTASRPTKDNLQKGRIWGRVLDYGSGKGMDSKFLLSEGFEVLSYDPYYEPTDISKAGKFDTVICNYVFNVIEDEQERIELFKTLVSYLHVGAKLLITGRPVKEIDKAAKTSKWTAHKDGWITGKKTFQKGISKEYMQEIMDKADINLPLEVLPYKSTAGYTLFAVQLKKFYNEG